MLDTDKLLDLAQRAQSNGGDDWFWTDGRGRPDGLRWVEDADLPGGGWYRIDQGAHLGTTMIAVDDTAEGTGDHAAFIEAVSPAVVTELIRRLRAAEACRNAADAMLATTAGFHASVVASIPGAVTPSPDERWNHPARLNDVSLAVKNYVQRCEAESRLAAAQQSRLRTAESELDMRRRMNVDAIKRLCEVLPGATGCETLSELLELLIARRQPVTLDGADLDLDALARDMATRIATALEELRPPTRETCERCCLRPAMIGEHRCSECM